MLELSSCEPPYTATHVRVEGFPTTLRIDCIPERGPDYKEEAAYDLQRLIAMPELMVA